MVSLIKKFFGKSEKPVAIKVAEAAIPEPFSPVPAVEVTHLSLAAILNKLPDDLLPSILRQPDEAATVVLPVATILKQLPGGAVRMSLASLRRQSPEGTFSSAKLEEKRLINVPLPEVFRHIKPETLPRRQGQRMVTIDDGSPTLFGNANNRFEVAPAVSRSLPEAEPVSLAFADNKDGRLKMDEFPPPPSSTVRPENGSHTPIPPPVAASSTIEPQRVIAPPPDMGGLRLAPKAPEPTEVEVQEVVLDISAPSLAPEPESGPEPVSSEPAPQPLVFEGPRLVLPIATLSAGWPEVIRTELAQLGSEATIALPVAEIKTGLANGRIAFRWIDLRSWINPQVSSETVSDPDLSLMLPLKVVAPAYLAEYKNETGAKKTVTVDNTIPALFNQAAEQHRAEVSPPDSPPQPPASDPQPELPATDSPAEPAQAKSQPEPLNIGPQPEPAFDPDPEPLAVVSQPEIPAAAVTIEREKEPRTQSGRLGELFGKPDKLEWTPAEVVEQTLHLPGVCGAIVALQEGLQVAHSLPEGIKSEVVAAFLPQIFARLNQYAEEMKLGEVDDLLFTTHGAHCQIYRLGFLYFAVLGRPGEPLPWRELRVIAEELAREAKP